MSGSIIVKSRRYRPRQPELTRKFVKDPGKVEELVRIRCSVKPRNERQKTLVSKKADGSFTAEENPNELVTPALGARDVQKSPMFRQKHHFEEDMDQHGLLRDIVHIEKLNNFFGYELGTNNAATPSQYNKRTADSETASSPQSYAFPFQKRTRSNSPPRNGQLFDQTKEKSKDSRIKPIVANFVLPRKENVGENWMYQRLEPDQDANSEEELNDAAFFEFIKQLS